MNSETTQPRRQFLRQFALGTVVSTLAGKTTINRVLAALEDEDTSGTVTIKVSDYPVLAATNGSIRINLHLIAGNGKPGRWYPIILTRSTVPGTTFFPLEGRCTHEECVLRWFGWESTPGMPTTYIACHCHESKYRRNGTVLAGPATLPLTAYPYTFDGTFVKITMPGFYHKLDVGPAQLVNGPRLRLDFGASRNGDHKILHRTALGAPWTPVSFSLTPDGQADQTVYKYENYDIAAPDTQNTSLYLDFPGDHGYFAVELQYEVEHN